MKMIKLQPVHHELVWGTEDWIISAHKNGDNTIEGSELNLSEFYETNKEFFGNCPSETFPLLVKIIDAKKALSVQVHPGDEYAKRVENSLGKTECWYIMDAAKDSDIIVGQNAKNREELATAIKENKILDYLNIFEINKGDFFFIPSGAVHAIRSNTKILEIQQSSDITYRLYDYERPGLDGKPRELHVEKSLDVIDYDYKLDGETIKEEKIGDTTKIEYTNNKFFKVDKYDVQGNLKIEADKYFTMGICLGDMSVNGTEFKENETFICAANVDIELEGNAEVFISTYGG